VLFGLSLMGFTMGIAAYSIATNLSFGSPGSVPLNPEIVGAFGSGLVGSMIMLVGLFLWSHWTAQNPSV
jgi:hypothetical protein